MLFCKEWSQCTVPAIDAVPFCALIGLKVSASWPACRADFSDAATWCGFWGCSSVPGPVCAGRAVPVALRTCICSPSATHALPAFAAGSLTRICAHTHTHTHHLLPLFYALCAACWPSRVQLLFCGCIRLAVLPVAGDAAVVWCVADADLHDHGCMCMRAV